VHGVPTRERSVRDVRLSRKKEYFGSREWAREAITEWMGRRAKRKAFWAWKRELLIARGRSTETLDACKKVEMRHALEDRGQLRIFPREGDGR